MCELKASDLHMSASVAPLVRKDGEMRRLHDAAGPLSSEMILTLLREIMPAVNQAEFEARHDTDFAYEIAGPLFFGAAQKAMAALHTVDKGVRVVILDLRAVPMLDATGLVGLESAFERLHRDDVMVVVGGAQPQPLRAMARAGWQDRKGRIAVFGSFERAVEEVRKAFE